MTLLIKVINPADFSDEVGDVIYATESDLDECLSTANEAFTSNGSSHPQILESLAIAADLFESNRAELLVIVMREAGKTYQDAIDEVREAVDFL
jgi:Delta 1-pyrroline-5-carboxylate dehydrogenase